MPAVLSSSVGLSSRKPLRDGPLHHRRNPLFHAASGLGDLVPYRRKTGHDIPGRDQIHPLVPKPGTHIGPKTRPPMLLRPTTRFPLRRIEPDRSLGGITKSRHPASPGIATLLDSLSVAESPPAGLRQIDSRVATQPEVFSWCTRTTDPADLDRYTAARSRRSLAASAKTGSTSHPIRRSLQCFTVDPKLSNTRIFIAASISRSPAPHAGSK